MNSTQPTGQPSRRAFTRLLDSVVLGAVLGVLMGVVAFVVAAFLIVLLLGSDPSVGAFIVVAIFLGLPSVAGACWVLNYEAFVIFRFRPGSPIAFATSVFIPYGIAAIGIVLSGETILGMIGLLLGLAFATAGFRGMRRAWTHAHGALREGAGTLCAHCGYDLSATAEGLVCPECGGVMRYEKHVHA